MKIKTLTFFIILTLVTSLKLFGQFKITHVFVNSKEVLVHNIYDVSKPLPQGCTSDTNNYWTYINIEAQIHIPFDGTDFSYDTVAHIDYIDPTLSQTTDLYFRIDLFKK
jgi:hypothetical protein